MTEKLKNEIERLCQRIECRKALWFQLDEKDKCLLYSPTRANIAAEIAEYFYNLALKDVRKEVEDTALKIACPGYSSISACRNIIKYIDSLTK